MKKIRQAAAVYFALQGAAVVVWWLLLFFVPGSRRYFQLGDSETVLLAFWLPDLILLGAGSLIVSVFCYLNHKFLIPALWLAAGAVSYASFYCLAFAWLTGTGWLGVTLMFPAMIWTGNFAVGLSPAFVEMMFRRSVESKTGWILTKTFTQIIVVWGLILFVFPFLITSVETKLGLVPFVFPAQKIFSAILFCALSLPGVAAAYTMAKLGRGTPLPMDTASVLVVAGIYSFVRNPMAISGVGQALAVGLFLGSPLVLLYALMGGLIWQLIFRPLEEADLLLIFEDDYHRYAQNVRCWIPLLSRLPKTHELPDHK